MKIIGWIFKYLWFFIMFVAIVAVVLFEEFNIYKKVLLIILLVGAIISQIYAWFILDRKIDK